MVSAQRRSRSSRSEVASRLLMARMPVSGVRTSWANAASAASTMPGPDTAARLRRGLTGGFLAGGFLAGSFLARFFAGRFLVSPVERRTRGFAAMVPCPAGPACHVTAARVTGGFAVVTAGKLRQLHPPPDIRRGCPGRAQFAQTGGPGRFRELLARRRPSSADDAGRPAAASPSSDCSSRCTLVDQNRSLPRTTSVMPCSASSITTDR